MDKFHNLLLNIVSFCIYFLAEIVNDVTDPCNPSPCGANTVCNDGVCSCLPEYNGDPYFECRPECTLSSDCGQNKACYRNKCVNPCNSGVCASNAICEVINHIPMCKCPIGMTGNAFVHCSPLEGKYEYVTIVYFLISSLKFNIWL